MRLLPIETTQVAASRTSKQNRKLGSEADLLPTVSFSMSDREHLIDWNRLSARFGKVRAGVVL